MIYCCINAIILIKKAINLIKNTTMSLFSKKSAFSKEKGES